MPDRERDTFDPITSKTAVFVGLPDRQVTRAQRDRWLAGENYVD